MKSSFEHFIEQRFHFSHKASLQQDQARHAPVIKPERIFKAVAYQPVFGQQSLLEVDQFSRSSDRVGPKLSDTTMIRALDRWDLDTLRHTLITTHLQLRCEGNVATVLSTGRRVQLAIADGTNAGGLWFSAVAMAGPVFHILDVQPYESRGLEREASWIVLRRLRDRLGKGFATHLLYDDLIGDRPAFRFAWEELGMPLVVKTTDERLLVIQRAQWLWKDATREQRQRMGVEEINGLHGTVRYRVEAMGGLVWEGLKGYVKVARVEETPLKGKRAGHPEVFWVLTTDQSLTALEMRELAQARWAIENNGFKELNEQVGSKRAYIKNSRVKETLMLIWSIGLAMLKAFRLWLEQQAGNAVKITKKWLTWKILFDVDGLEERAPSRAGP